jgi:signal transduction histidine kinase/ligand-binding sensor domain-containing protein
VKELLASLLALFLAPSFLQASRLPIKTYTTADGLARDFVLCIEQDSHGFLWFCTAEGLSRFDGYRFTSYRVEQGLPANFVTDFLETRHGSYWIATEGGLARYDPAGPPPRFHRVALPGNAVPSVLYEDRAGAVWCGASTGDGGLFRLGSGESSFRPVKGEYPDSRVTAILVDRRGGLWLGTPAGVCRRDPDGTVRTYPPGDTSDPFVMALAEGTDGRVWVGTRGGLVRIDPGEPGGAAHRRTYARKDGLPGSRIESLLVASDGKLWVGTNQGLAEWTGGSPATGGEFQAYTLEQGLSARSVGALAEDRDGNIWVGTFGSGAMKVARRGFTTFSDADGFPQPMSLLETRQGEVCALNTNGETAISIVRFDGKRFEPIRPRWPSSINYFGWGRGQIALQDEGGEWWIATGQGLCRFARTDRVESLAGAAPRLVYTKRDGLPGDNIFRVFEDSRRNIWIGTIGGPEDGLALWDRATGRIRAFSADGPTSRPVPTAFAEGPPGTVWVGLFHGGLGRYRDGRFALFTERDGVAGVVRCLFVDSAGILWIGSSRGLIRVADASAQAPTFDAYDASRRLASSDIAAITEDASGRIYAATGRGIDRFEPGPSGPRRIQHYTTADGIAPGELQLALRDRQGDLWFSTPLGVSRLVPTADRPPPPPPVLVTGVSAGGVPRPISDLGESSVSGLTVRETPLQIDFVGLGFSPGEAIRYQYRLEGADRDWGAPTDQRAVVYARLSPGTYRFLVRAVASEGAVSPIPASVSFRVLPPVWRRWWFLLASAVAALLIIYSLHRHRLAQLLAVAEIRTRIATDLHDDIGASLSQIAILSEVARQPSGGQAPSDRPLSEIAGISRELVDSMSDIVWAINPEHDRLSNLAHRMRRFATDLLGGQKIALRFHSSVAEDDPRLDANVRRQVYLIFKEAVHNAARHSGARAVEVELDAVADGLRLRVTDDGRGFDSAAEHDGHGLSSMRRRSRAVGGALEIRPRPDGGTELVLIVPLPRANTLSMLRGKVAARFR